MASFRLGRIKLLGATDKLFSALLVPRTHELTLVAQFFQVADRLSKDWPKSTRPNAMITKPIMNNDHNRAYQPERVR